MTLLSDADRELAGKILAAWEVDETQAARDVKQYPENAAAMLSTAEAVITAKILAAAGVDEDAMVEAMVESATVRLGLPGNTKPSAAMLCATKADMRAALIAIKPTLARLAAENARMREALSRWQSYGCPDCGGDCASANPPVLCCLVQETRAALGDTP